MRVLILANGDPPSTVLAQRLAAQHDLLLATDGAALKAADLGLKPDIICGDFDSVPLDVVRSLFPQAEFIPTPDQEAGDLEKALVLAQERGATIITITGAGGGRMDHTLANYAVLLRYAERIFGTIEDDFGKTFPVFNPGEGAICKRFDMDVTPGDTISLITFEGARGITLTGTKWPLDNEQLEPGTRGISNIATEEKVTIHLEAGSLLVCHLHQDRIR